MKNKRILVTGMAGSIGSELARQLHHKNKLYGLDIDEMRLHAVMTELKIPVRVGDIRNRDTLRDVFFDFRPQIVFHAAAYKSVDMMEYVPQEAIHTNVVGTENVLYYSKVTGIEKFVFISSDKAVNAKSIMGKTKSLGETMTVNSGNGYVAVRFGNVLGSRGSLLEIWEKQLNEGKAITVTDERMLRYFMTIEEAVSLVIEAATIGHGGEVICFDMKKPVKIIDLASRIAKELRGEVEVTGIRPGEQLEERLMTLEEEQRAVKKGRFFIIK